LRADPDRRQAWVDAVSARTQAADDSAADLVCWSDAGAANKSVNIKNREDEAQLGKIKAAIGKGASQIVLGLVREEVARLQKKRVVA
jgi:hypothetical protein